MKFNVKKIDLSGVKEFLFQKGERVGLAICGGIAVLLLGVGLLKVGGSGTSYAKDFQSASKNKLTILGQTAEDNVEKPVPKEIKDPWGEALVKFDPAELAPFGDKHDTKRRNPTIFKSQDDEKHIKVDYIRAGYFAYELEKDKAWAFEGGGNEKAAVGVPAAQGAANAGGRHLAKIMNWGRMVVVSSVFPMREQLEEYRKKLRFATLEELLANPDSVPKALGLNVYRCEMKADGKTFTEWSPLFKYNPKKDRIEVAERIDRLFREAYLDEDNAKTLVNHLQPGLATPLPLLANAQYPKLDKLEDIKLVEGEPLDDKQPKGAGADKMMPKKGGIMIPGGKKDAADPVVGDEAKFVLVPWKKLPKELADKFSGSKFDADPFGAKQDKDDAKGPAAMMKDKGPMGVVPMKDGDNPANPNELYDALVRFIDIDVEPGKTYLYSFQVRMKNPNEGRRNDVAFQALADIKELESPFAYSPPVTIPGEFFVYALDQRPNTDLKDGSDTKPARAEAPVPYGQWNTTVQVHRWLKKFTGDLNATVADWAIAERLLVRRGDTIGRYGVNVEIPVWNKSKEAFEIGYHAQKVNVKNKAKHFGGVPVDFVVDAPPPLLVDFEGGWKTQVKIGNSPAIPRDEAAVEMLILTPEGKLILRNSRNDTDLANPAALERNERWDTWRKGVDKLKGGGTTGKGGITMPK